MNDTEKFQLDTFKNVFFQNFQNHANGILLHCDGFTLFKELIRSTIHVVASTCLSTKYEFARLIGIADPNIETFVILSKILNHVNRI